MGRFSNNIRINLDNSINRVAIERIISTSKIDKIVKGYYRPYQMDMWKRFKDAIKDFANGVEDGFLFQAGTGTGKTEIFKFISPYLIAKAADENEKEGKVFGLVCHRLCLIKDLGTRIIPTLLNKYSTDSNDYWSKTPAGCELPESKIKFYYVNSGKALTYLDKELNASNVAGKHVKDYTKEQLEKEIANNKKNGIHSCFICLYQSIAAYGNTLMKDIHFDWLICDEIHTIDTNSTKEYTTFSECAKFFERNGMKFYFTATPLFDSRDTRQNMDSVQVMTMCE